MHGNGKRLIIVLGMHRAGTSVAARALEVMGVELGQHLIEPRTDNPKGFWEDVDINAFNVDMLHFLGSDWDYLAPIQAEDTAKLEQNGFLPRAVELLRQKTENAPLFGFKDPRMAKLLPFWKQAFEQGNFEAEYVVAIRHPYSVYQSLAKRDGFTAEKSYLLWLGYSLGALAGTQGETRVVVDYDRLIQSPEAEVTRMARGLELQADAQKLGLFKTEFVDQRLRHDVHTPDELRQEEGVPPLVYEVYRVAMDAACDKPGEQNVEAFMDRWLAEFSRQEASLVLADQLQRRIERLEAQVAEGRYKDTVLAAKEELIATKDQAIAESNQTIARKEQDAKRLTAEAQALQATVDSMLQSGSWKLTRPLRATKTALAQLRARLRGSS